MLDYLMRVGPALRKLAGALRVWGYFGGGLGLLIVVLLTVLALPLTASDLVWLVISAIAVSWASVVLLLFARSLTAVADLPEWIRMSPDVLSRNGTELAKVYLDTAGKWGEQSHFRALRGGIWRGGRLVLSVAKDIPEFAAVGSMANPLFLIATVVATFWIAAEMFVAPMLVLATLLTR